MLKHKQGAPSGSELPLWRSQVENLGVILNEGAEEEKPQDSLVTGPRNGFGVGSGVR